MQSKTRAVALRRLCDRSLRSVFLIAPILMSTACLSDTSTGPIQQYRVHGTITVDGTGTPAASVSVVVYDDYYSLNAPIARGTTGSTASMTFLSRVNAAPTRPTLCWQTPAWGRRPESRSSSHSIVSTAEAN